SGCLTAGSADRVTSGCLTGGSAGGATSGCLAGGSAGGTTSGCLTSDSAGDTTSGCRTCDSAGATASAVFSSGTLPAPGSGRLMALASSTMASCSERGELMPCGRASAEEVTSGLTEDSGTGSTLAWPAFTSVEAILKSPDGGGFAGSTTASPTLASAPGTLTSATGGVVVNRTSAPAPPGGGPPSNGRWAMPTGSPEVPMPNSGVLANLTP